MQCFKGGWTGKVLVVDLCDARSQVIEPSEEVYLKNVGGRGLAGHFLWKHREMEWDHPEMPIVFATGPLVGTRAPTSGRMTIASKSPLTGTICDTSVGGGLGIALKKAGFDAVVVSGKSPGPVGIVIQDSRCRMEDASGAVGLTLGEIASRLGSFASFAATGPAADNKVCFAGIMVDRRFSAGRGGLGLCMAEKGLKFLAVAGRGLGGDISVADAPGLDEARAKVMRQVSASPALMGPFGLAKLGTRALYDLMHTRRMMPTANFRATYFPDAPNLNAAKIEKQYLPKKSGCKGCHVQCKQLASDGRDLPEFETLSHFTALLENNDLEAAVEANRICNEMGMDTISAAGTLACYSEIEGRRLEPDEIERLLLDTARGMGVGRHLAPGSRILAARRGRPDASMTVKGMELPAYDPRGAYGMALAYVTSTRGGCHLRAYPISHEILRKPVASDRFSFSGKARMIKLAEDANAAVDSLTACKFLFFATSLEEYAGALTAVTGVEFTAQDLERLGERIYYRERMFNSASGFTAKDDDLPSRFFTEPGSSGSGIEVPPLDREEFLAARSRYYKVRRLDQNGMPLAETARELEIQ